MDSSLYNAASQGKVDVLRQHIDQIEIQTTANRNTSLHVAAQFGQLQCVAAILEACPSMLGLVNIRGETPLHMAAREGYADIVKELIECAKKVEQELESGFGGEAKKMLRATNVDRDTALHLAVRNCRLKKDKYLEVIKLLTKEDREFEHPANHDEETPLYLAAERGIVDVVVMLLKTCTSPTYGGPGGRTALHAATFNLRDRVLNKLLDWKQELIKDPDAYGWTPLHSAARYGNVKAVKKLLEKDKSVAYVAANGDEGNTALHIAAAVGEVNVMAGILSYCPDCWEMVNSKGQNILHIAAYYERDQTANFILKTKRPWMNHLLINQKDNEGNTPLHVLASNRINKLLREYPGADMYADFYAVNYETWTPLDVECGEVNSKDWPRPILRSNGRATVRKDRERIIEWRMSMKQTEQEKEERRKEERGKKEEQEKEEREEKEEQEKEEQEKKEEREKEERRHKRVEGVTKTHMIVATLIATISFTASFTIPGGYHVEGPYEGMAVLVRDAAFKAFVITNTVAVVCSTSSVFLYLSVTFFKIVAEEEEEQKKVSIYVARRYLMALWLVVAALFSMTLAFVTGTYSVLGHSLGLAIPTCVIACSSFMVYASEFTKLYRKFRAEGY
ncbi:hypothetical protein Vadar_014664 [Vaccinium darrowii]|uniref:Uncharacterized protein n=1 Tax=Vaccinium darrowii TaxID=229202 RepID=A0ACB7YDV9_9ERIC|nr:hypothetical protein Vadar_014664 [Vaccinium darrowii]